MRRLLLWLLVILLGAAILSPMIYMMGLDPLPGDFTFLYSNTQILVPVTYSLCASLGLALLYYLLKR